MTSEGATSFEDLATMFAEQGNFAAAVDQYKAALQLQPHDGTLYEQLAQCLLETEQYHDAYQAASVACYRAPQVKQPHDQEVQEEWAEVNRLQQQELALKIGLPGLQIEQVYGGESGPGHVVWQAGIVLSRYCLAHPELVKGRQVLELGCGTGVLGITLACLGAQVTLTDTADILPHVKRNILCNEQLIQSGKGAAAGTVLDWREAGAQPIMNRLYDVIIGADLLYSAKNVTPLADVLAELRQHSTDCTLILAHQNRCQDVTDQFLKQLDHNGFSLKATQVHGAVSIYTT